MHVCLQVSEILRVIFAKVTEVRASNIRSSYATLYHLALTCRTFRELALDALWAHIHASYILVMCRLPQDAGPHCQRVIFGRDLSISAISICRSDMATAGCMVRFPRSLVDDDLAIFQKYVCQIRSLTFEKYDVRHRWLRGSIEPVPWDLHASPSTSISRHQLYWYDNRDVLLSSLQRCVSTTLTRLVIHSECCPPALVDLLASVGKACSKIKEFRCSTPTASARTMLSDIIPCWDDLEILETVVVNAQTLKHFASLKQLRELNILVPEGYSLETTSPFSVILSMDKIGMTAPRLKLLLAFLAPLQLSVKRAQLNIETATNAVDLDYLLSSLTEHFESNVLESLNVGVACPTDFDDHTLFELTTSALRRLWAFTGLTNLDLSSMYISITDDEIIDLVSAWPQMTHLHLDTDWEWEVTRMGVTFLGLAGVLKRCPELRSLGINLDTTAPTNSPSLTHHQYAGTTGEQITDLRVGYAECNDVEAIGNILHRMCPSLNHIHSTRPVNPDYEDFFTDHPFIQGVGIWKKVEDVIIRRRREQLYGIPFLRVI